MKTLQKRRFATAWWLVGGLTTALLFSASAQATNGYFQHGFGTHSKGMAGAGSALPQDLQGVVNNPAGLAKLPKQMNLGLQFFAPDRSYTANPDFDPPPTPSVPAGSFDSENTLFLIPSFGYGWDLGEKSKLAFTLTGNGGMNTDYKTSTFERFAAPPGTPFNPTGEFTAGNNTGIDLIQLMGRLTYSYEFAPNHAIGVAPVGVVQRFKANGLQPFRALSKHPGEVTNNGYDTIFGGGFAVGYLGTFFDRLNLGVSYMSQIWSQKFDDYKGLFAKNGEFDVPPMFKAGLAFYVTPKLVLVGDYTWINYGTIDAVNNSNDITFAELQSDPERQLGGSRGLGFGWGNVSVWHVGIQYQFDDTWTFRAGYSKGDEPWKDVNTLFNVLAPATIEEHISIGFSANLTKNDEITFAYTHMPRNTIEGTSTFTGSQTGNVQMTQNDWEILWVHRF